MLSSIVPIFFLLLKKFQKNMTDTNTFGQLFVSESYASRDIVNDTKLFIYRNDGGGDFEKNESWKSCDVKRIKDEVYATLE